MGLLGLPMLLAPTIGPALSGFLVKHFNWSTVFLINLPVGVLALIFVLLFLPNFPANKASKIDLKGTLLSPFAFPILIYGVHVGTDKGWSNPTALSFVGLGIIMLLLFIIVELRVENPLYTFELLQFLNLQRNFAHVAQSNRCFRGHASCPTLLTKCRWTFF